ncbi:MAG: RDD family protein [Bacteroidota bacterium]
MEQHEPFHLSDFDDPGEPDPADLFKDVPDLPDTVALNDSLDGISFTTNPPPVNATPKKTARTVAPNLVPRVLAKIIDGAVAGVLYMLCSFLIADWFVGFLVGGIAATLYFVVSDGLDVRHMPQRSFGKNIMGLSVTRLDNEPMTAWVSAQRNWMFGALYFAQAFTFIAPAVSVLVLLVALGLIGYEVYWVVVNPQGIRWGDDLAGTEVVQPVLEPA